MFKKIVSLMLCLSMVSLLGMNIYSHDNRLNVQYDECSQEEHIDGEDET